jgi:hypothetical protein
VKWRDIVVGALVTLFVTVVAGIIVWYVTRQPQPSTERLVYNLTTSATFGSDAGSITFLSAKVRNTGGKAARNVRIAGSLPSGYVLQDRRVTLSSGPAASFTDSSSNTKLELTIPSFAPSEEADLSLLVKGPNTPNMSLGVQSDDSLGTLVTEEAIQDQSGKAGSLPPSFGIALVAVALVAQIVLTPRVRSALRGLTPARDALNDTAFVYLQQGLVDEAEQILTKAISDRGGNVLSLANRGLALGLKGDVMLAMKHLDAAEWWAGSNHEMAVIEYDRAVLAVHEGNIGEALGHLTTAFRLSPVNISWYCRLNIYVRAAAAENSELDELIRSQSRTSIAARFFDPRRTGFRASS